MPNALSVIVPKAFYLLMGKAMDSLGSTQIPFNRRVLVFNLTRSEQKRFDDLAKYLWGYFMGPRGDAENQGRMLAGHLHADGLLDLRSPARKAAEAKVLEVARKLFSDPYLDKINLVVHAAGELNALIASESAPSVEWSKAYGQGAWYVQWREGRKYKAEPVPGNTEAAADVLVAHLNSVERGK